MLSGNVLLLGFLGALGIFGPYVGLLREFGWFLGRLDACVALLRGFWDFLGTLVVWIFRGFWVGFLFGCFGFRLC